MGELPKTSDHVVEKIQLAKSSAPGYLRASAQVLAFRSVCFAGEIETAFEMINRSLVVLQTDCQLPLQQEGESVLWGTAENLVQSGGGRIEVVLCLLDPGREDFPPSISVRHVSAS